MSWSGIFPCVRSLGKIFLYLVLVVLCGAFAAPLVWHLTQALPSGWLNGLIGHVQGMPFHRYLSRSLQISALLLLWPLLRSLRIKSLAEFGLKANEHRWLDFSISLIAGLLGMMLLWLFSLLSGDFALRHEALHGAVFALPRILVTAILVAVMEEFLFRGVLLGFFRQFTPRAASILLSSLIFAGMHFLNLPSSSVHGVPAWSSGLSALCGIGQSLPAWPDFGWAFGTLVTAGVILGWMTVRTSSLWAAIGLHATWILGQQLFNTMASTQFQSQRGSLPFIGIPQCHGMVPIGLVPLISLIFAALVIAFLRGKRGVTPTPALVSG
jgi:uncharacterized protein